MDRRTFMKKSISWGKKAAIIGLLAISIEELRHGIIRKE